METCKFIEEFNRVTNGAFPMLKFSGATYLKASQELTVKFLISAFEYKEITENSDTLSKIEGAVASICPGIKTSVKFIKTYADEAVVRNKVLEYFNAGNSMIFRRLNGDTLVISVTDDMIRVELRFDAAICRMLETGDGLNGLKFALERTFM